MKKNLTLNNAFPIVAAALGNKFGVNVRVGGQDAYTDGKSINIPAYNLEDPSYKDVAWGYLAHEAAHVRFTDMVDFRNGATSPIRKSIVNILEDIRIEKMMQDSYPGTKRTTEKVVEHLVKTGGFQIVGQDQNVHPAAVLSQFLLFRLRNDVLGQNALSSYADTAESLLEVTFPVGAVTRLAGLLSEVPDLDSTRDCVRLADRILRMLEEEQEKEQEKARQQQQSQDQDSDDSSSQSQSNSAQDEDQTDDGSDDFQPDSQPQSDDTQDDQDLQDQSQVQDSQQSDDDGNDLDQQSGQGNTQSAGSSSDQSQDVDSEHTLQILSSVLSAGEDDVPDDLFEAVQELLGQQPRNAYDSDVHLPLAIDPTRNPSIGNALISRVLNESGKIRASLQGLVQSSRYDRPVNKRSGNRIDGRKLSRLVQGDSRVFERRNHRQSPNTAIHLLVDASGSMNGCPDASSRVRLIDLAMDSAVALALALEGISGVNSAITRFPHGDTDNVNPLLKHGQKVRPNASVFSAITNGGTPLHTALWYAAASVMATKEDRKVIMVLTDGEPDDYDAAKSVIRRCEATGIELVGVGICIDTSHLFDNSICINNVSELRSELFKISRDLLLAA
jgi:cobalamin biosynthesis protein CobT